MVLFNAEIWRDVIYDDMWSMLNRYVCERTGIQPTLMMAEQERKIIQNAIDVITDIILDKVELKEVKRDEDETKMAV